MTFPRLRRAAPAAILVAAFLAGCAELAPTSTVTSTGGREPAEPAREGPFARVYTCPDGFRFSARSGPEEARLDLGTRILKLPREPSDSGARYSDGETLFRVRGGEATIEVDASIRSGCRGRNAADPWAAAGLRGVDLRALGQEPGWSAEVVHGEWLRLVEQGREGALVARGPARERAGSSVTLYSGRADGQRLRLRVTESPCSDVTSGESFPLTAELTIGGRELRGCARRL